MAVKKNKSSEYRKGQEIKVRIIDIGMRGEGIGKLEDGYTVFIKDAVIGDYVRASIMKANKSYAYAHLDQILQASPHRVEPLCPVARQCGGCQLQALSYDQELVYKQNKVRADLIRIGGFSEEEIDAVMGPIVGMQDNPKGPWRYRNKAQVPVGKNSAGRIVAGFYAGRTHSIIPMTDCKLGEEINSGIINRVLTYMEIHKVPPYDENTGKGLIRHILIRSGKYSGQIMVCLVVNGDSLPYESDLVEHLRSVPGMASIVLNVNKERTNVILGRQLRTLWGQDEINDIRENGFPYVESTRAFGQGGFDANMPLPELDEILDKCVDMGVLYRASSIEELAKMINVDAATLSGVIADYNSACEAGEDAVMGKGAENLRPVTGDTYYAFKCINYTYGTDGGLDVDEQLNVLREDGSVIDGLYATGYDCSGVLYNSNKAYVDYGGAALGWGFTSGRLAGQNAVEAING